MSFCNFRVFRLGVIVAAGLFSLRVTLGVAAQPVDTAATPAAEEAAALVSGRAALQDGLYDTAADYLQRYVEKVSVTNGQAEGVLLWCDALRHLERYDEALLLLDQHAVGVTNPALNAAFTYARASMLFDQEQWDAAQALLEGVPKGVGDVALRGNMLRLSIRCNMASGRMEAAMGQYERFLEEFADSPDVPRILLDWAASLIRMRQTERARKVIKRMVGEYGASAEAAEARLWDGQLYLDERAPDLAMPVLEALTTATNVDQDVRSRAWFAVAQAREQQTNYVQAIEALNLAVSNQPNPELEQQSGLLRARLLIQSGEYTNGTELLHRWVALHASSPGAADALLNAAFELLKQKQNAQAATEFQHYLEAFSDAEGVVRALIGRSWAFYELKRYAEAASGFEKAAARTTDEAQKREALLQAANAWFAGAQYKQAKNRYLEYAGAYPADVSTPLALYQAAECLAKLNETEQAEKLFRRLEEEQPASEYAQRAVLREAQLKEYAGDFGAALECYNRFLSDYPESVLALRAIHERALVEYRLGLYEQAMTDFEQVVKLGPNDPLAEQAFFMRGWTLYLMGKSAEALEVCQQFIQVHSQSAWAPNVLFWLAEYRFNQQQYEEAEHDFSGLAEQYPEQELADDALYWAGRSAAARHEYVKAIDYYNQLTARYPNSPKMAEARFAQGDALSELGQFAGAILAFDEVVKNYPESYLADLARGRKGDCQFTLGSDDQNRYAEAIASYTAILNQSDSPLELKLQAQYKIGRCEEKSGSDDRALDHYMKVVYDFMALPGRKSATGAIWFTRAAFNAADICESARRWKEAMNIYKRVSESGVPAAQEAQARMQKIQLEHWFFWE